MFRPLSLNFDFRPTILFEPLTPAVSTNINNPSLNLIFSFFSLKIHYMSGHSCSFFVRLVSHSTLASKARASLFSLHSRDYRILFFCIKIVFLTVYILFHNIAPALYKQVIKTLMGFRRATCCFNRHF